MATNGKLKVHLSCRITKFQDESIEGLKNSGVLGDDRADVVRALLQLAIERLMETGQIKKLKEWKNSVGE